MRLRNIKGTKQTIAKSRYVLQDPEDKKGKWNKFFQNTQPIHIEIGMGKGQFLMEMAKNHSDINYLGIEKYDSVLVRALNKTEEIVSSENVSNLLFLRIDAADLINIFEKEEVSKIYLNFSDPWPKERHEKRRLMSRKFLDQYEKILKKGGTIEFKTDNRGLFEFSLEQIEKSVWKLESETFDLHRDEILSQGNIMTEYEEKFVKEGIPIHKLIISYLGEG